MTVDSIFPNDPWAGLHNKGAKTASEAVPGNVMEYILKKENLSWIEREVMKKYHVLCQERILESEARPSFFFYEVSMHKLVML